jgi:hypothetical protein
VSVMVGLSDCALVCADIGVAGRLVSWSCTGSNAAIAILREALNHRKGDCVSASTVSTFPDTADRRRNKHAFRIYSERKPGEHRC